MCFLDLGGVQLILEGLLFLLVTVSMIVAVIVSVTVFMGLLLTNIC